MKLLNEWIETHGIVVHPYEDCWESVIEMSHVTGFLQEQLGKVSLMRNKYSANVVACVYTAGARVDKRELVSTDEGGTKAWLYIPNAELEGVSGFPPHSIPPIGLPGNILKIYVDPRIMRLEEVVFPAGSNCRSMKINPDILLEDPRTEVKPISIG